MPGTDDDFYAVNGDALTAGTLSVGSLEQYTDNHTIHMYHDKHGAWPPGLYQIKRHRLRAQRDGGAPVAAGGAPAAGGGAPVDAGGAPAAGGGAPAADGGAPVVAGVRRCSDFFFF